MSVVRRAITDLPTWGAALLAAGSGALAVFGFAPLAWYGLILISLGGLFALWFGRDWRDAPAIGYAFGLGWFGAGIHWVWYSAYVYGGTPWPLAIIINGLLVAILALYPAVLGWLARRYLGAARGPLLAIALAALWVVVEGARSILFSGFPWLNPGYAFVDAPLAGFAPIGGVNLVGGAALLTVTVGVLVALRRMPAGWLILPIGIWGIGQALTGVSWTQPQGGPLAVAIIQGNIDQSAKWRPEQRLQIIERYLEMSAQHLDVDLIVWPETALPVFFDQAEPLLREFDRDARDKGVGVLIGAPVREPDGRYFNSLVALGAATGEYRKRHLVPFGEYVPLSDLFGRVIQFLDVPMSNFSTGDARQPLMRAGRAEIAATICFEDVFPTETHTHLGMPNLLVNVSNDAWFGRTWAPDQHLQIARMRAIEAGRYLVRATNTGLSALIDAHGALLVTGRPWNATVVRANVALLIGETPYRAVGEGVVILAAMLIFGGCLVRSRAS